MNSTLFLNKVFCEEELRAYFDCFPIDRVDTKTKYTFVRLSDKASAITILKMKQYVINGQLTQVSMAKTRLNRSALTPEELAIVDRKGDPLVPQPSEPEAPTYSQLMKQKEDFLWMVVQQGEQQKQYSDQLRLMQTMGTNLQANQSASLLNQRSNLRAGNLGSQLGGQSGLSASAPPGIQYVQPNAGPLPLPDLTELMAQLNMVRTQNQPLLCFPPTMNPTIAPGRSASQLGPQNVGVSGQSGLVGRQAQPSGLLSGQANQRLGQQPNLPNASVSQILQNQQSYPQTGQQMPLTNVNIQGPGQTGQQGGTSANVPSAKTSSKFPEWNFQSGSQGPHAPKNEKLQ